MSQKLSSLEEQEAHLAESIEKIQGDTARLNSKLAEAKAKQKTLGSAQAFSPNTLESETG